MKQIFTICAESMGGSEIKVGVVSPDSGKAERMLLLLHGYGGNFCDMSKKMPLQEMADKYLVAIVCPNMGNGYYIDRPGKANVGVFLSDELLHSVKRCCGIPTTEGVILAGISMGGYGSVLVAAHHPYAFSHVIAISSAFICTDIAIGSPDVVGTTKEEFAYFKDTFGPDFDELENDPHRNPLAALRLVSNKEHIPPFYLCCGRSDEMYSRNLKALEKFGEHGIPYEWTELEGGHVFGCFTEGLEYFLKQIRATNK